MKKFVIEPARGYGYIMYPQDERLRKRLAEYGKETGFPMEEKAYFQNLYNVIEFLDESRPRTRRAVSQLSQGWGITILMDPWEALHAWGYDAYTLVE